MKKVLFASTALVMTAGVAAADVAITADANMGLKSIGGTTSVHHELEFFLSGSVATDSGITFGASSDLNTTATATDSHDREVYMSYEGLTLTVGGVSNASDVGGFSDVGFDGIGVDDDVEAVANHGTADVRIDYSFGDITAAMTADSAAGSNDWAIGLTGSVDAFSFALGYANDSGVNSTVLGLGYSAGALGASIQYETDGTDNGLGLSVSYTSGDLTVTAAYGQTNIAGDANDIGIGFAYDLGGATLAGGVGEVDNVSVADLGVSFSF